MSRKGQNKGPAPEVPPANDSLQRWVMRANGLAGACLCILVVIELFGFATPPLRALLIVGIVAGGTVAWVQQAKRKCPGCGHLYGYHFRLMKANICRKCGAEYPKWHPGIEDAESEE